MTIDLTNIICGICTLIGALVARYLVPLIKSKLDDRQMGLLNGLVRIGVFAAEQLFNSDQGREKKAYVVDLLRKNGYEVDSSAVDAMIEATVKELRIEMGQRIEGAA